MMETEEISEQDGKEELPAGWQWVRLGEVCDFLDSRRIPVNDAERAKRIAGKKQSELFPYYGANGQVGWIDGYLFDEPLILLAEDGGNFGSSDRPIAYAVSGRYWVNNHAHVLKPRTGVDFDYCLHSLRIRPDVGDLVSGSTRAKLNQEIAAAIRIPLPPLSEQKRIAAILNEQMAVVERARSAAEAQLEAAKALPAAYLRAVFNSPETQRWPRKRLREVCELLPAKSIASDGDIEVLAITTACLTEAGFQPSGVKTARMWARDAEECLVSPGEILIARSNTPDLVGRVAMFSGTPKGVVASDLTIRIRLKDDLNPPFLTGYLSFLYLTGYWKDRAGGASGSMKKITRTQLLDEQVPIPPLPEQMRIVACLSDQMAAAERTCKALEEQLDAISKLPAALLRRAFSGEL